MKEKMSYFFLPFTALDFEKWMRAVMCFFAVLCFASAIFYANESKVLRKIIRDNTTLKTNAEIKETIREIIVYKETGQRPPLPPEIERPLDKLIEKLKD